jgi:hypothetical protein
MLTSPTTAEISKALSGAQSQLGNPPRTKTVAVVSKSGARYTFKYAPLEAILDFIRAPMAAHGLSMVQAIGTEMEGTIRQLSLTTRLCHSSGEWMESVIPILLDGGGAQAMGGAITYARRYALTALLNLATEDDDDGNAADGNQATVQAPVKPTAKPVPMSKVAGSSTPHGVEFFAKAIELAPNVAALNAIARDIAKTLKTQQERDDIRPTFTKRMAELSAYSAPPAAAAGGAI